MSEPAYNFVEGSYHHRKVYTQKGNAVILGEDKAAGVYLVELIKNAEQIVLKANQLKFKAINDSYRDNYVIDKDTKTASGASSIHNGDELAETLKGLGVAELSSIAKDNGFADRFKGWQDSDANNGMLRMHVGNVLRAKAKKGNVIYAFGRQICEGLTDAGAIRAEERAAAAKQKAEARAARRAAREASKAAAATDIADAPAEATETPTDGQDGATEHKTKGQNRKAKAA